MKKPRICGVIVNKDLEKVREVEPLVELFEVRIDLIGEGWEGLAGQLKKPWMACNRRADEGGKWSGSEKGRVNELLRAVEIGADIVDLELRTGNLAKVVSMVKGRSKCLLSFHDLNGTGSPGELKGLIQRQLEAGADICKVVTTARSFEDNLTTLQLITEFPGKKVLSFAMGPLGLVSRVLCPLVGGYFSYASIEKGRESAPGQMTVGELMRVYEQLSSSFRGED
ncbi:MAG: type I 3-dehydroquinate dehydratase [Chloroflexota bacterium]|nr:type I 3-dehydroquinate dehydratase [Chloroflexota bacterium]